MAQINDSMWGVRGGAFAGESALAGKIVEFNKGETGREVRAASGGNDGDYLLWGGPAPGVAYPPPFGGFGFALGGLF